MMPPGEEREAVKSRKTHDDIMVVAGPTVVAMGPRVTKDENEYVATCNIRHGGDNDHCG